MRTFRVVIGGNEYEVGIEEITEKATAPVARERAQAAPAPKATPQSVTKQTAPAAAKAPPQQTDGAGEIIHAAMPGTITDVKVSQGDAVKRGDTLLILEAMKMENEIKAPIDGIVSTIEVSKGAAVNAGMALLVLA